jgi:hypothetical protein
VTIYCVPVARGRARVVVSASSVAADKSNFVGGVEALVESEEGASAI